MSERMRDEEKVFQKTLKKRLDKLLKMWYNKEVAAVIKSTARNTAS
ncbi:MAG: hypothetical protein IJN57_09215 [Oscillospiraceae bacterium]|nr:hypothetical protein [Oscillospiraceae bacterium]